MDKIKKIYKENKEIINYLIVGVLTTVVSLVIYYLLTYTILDPDDAFQLQAANVISWIGAVIFAYFTNRIFVFESKEKNMLKEISKFTLSRVGTLLMDMLLMHIMVYIIKIPHGIAKLIVQVIVIVLNYILSKFLVFNKKKS